MDTKKKILAVALELFNRYGTKAVTTNHIAKEAKISPGNLYYHFRNKEEIILQLYRQMRHEVGFEQKSLPDDICSLLAYCRFVAKVWWRYRFLKRELVHLIERDEALKSEVTSDSKSHYEKLLSLVDHLVKSGSLQELNEETKQFLALAISLFSNFWTPNWMLLGEEVDIAKATQVTQAVRKLFEPYLSPEEAKKLKKCEGV